MKYIANWETVQQRHTAFWEREVIDRCCVSATVPAKEPIAGSSLNGPGDPEAEELIDYWTNPERILERHLYLFDQTHFGADALPRIWVNLGPGITAAYLGSSVHLSKETIWFEPFIKDWQHDSYLFDPRSIWWERTKAITAALTRESGGDFLVSITDLSGAADIMCHLRGTEQLCIDLIEQPEEIKNVRDYIMQVLSSCYAELYDTTSQITNGSVCWLDLWAPGTQMVLQCDFCTMISPPMFQEFFLPEIAQQCREFEYPIYHLDGPGEIKHLDALLSIKELKAIQWVPNPGDGAVGKWLPMFKKIQQAGKGLYLALAPWYGTSWKDSEQLLQELSPNGLFIDTVCGSQEELQWMEQQVAKWSCRKYRK
jgi:hypothetical protein